MGNITIQLGQTVYGGSLNVTTGVMTIDMTIKTYQGQGEDWTLESKRFKYAKPSDLAGESVQHANRDKICSNEAIPDWGDKYGAYFSISNAYIWVNALDGNETLADFRARLYAHPIQICAMLATPQTIQLTPEQLTMLKGYNRLSSDGGGDITVEAYTSAAWGGDE